MKKTVATIEARMTSSRLPGKVLLPVLGKPILGYLFDRLKKVTLIDEIVLATTINKADDPIVDYAKSEGISVFRGSEDDVLLRVVDAAKYVGGDIIIEITGDCPIIDPELIDQCIQLYKFNNASYVGNAHVRSYPDGMDVQVFSLADLQKSGEMTNDKLDREHVSLFMRNHPEIFPHLHMVAPTSIFWPELGLTLDEKEDFELLKSIIEYFYSIQKPYFGIYDCVSFLKENPQLLEINQKVKRKGDT
ncbi:glycosyltransferase family protein [Leptospira sp. 96542]|nr:glycosyltransferase family protein [Leptospira sp. 96542]